MSGTVALGGNRGNPAGTSSRPEGGRVRRRGEGGGGKRAGREKDGGTGSEKGPMCQTVNGSDSRGVHPEN